MKITTSSAEWVATALVTAFDRVDVGHLAVDVARTGRMQDVDAVGEGRRWTGRCVGWIRWWLEDSFGDAIYQALTAQAADARHTRIRGESVAAALVADLATNILDLYR